MSMPSLPLSDADNVIRELRFVRAVGHSMVYRGGQLGAAQGVAMQHGWLRYMSERPGWIELTPAGRDVLASVDQARGTGR